MRKWSRWDLDVSLLPSSSGTQATTTTFLNFFYRLMHLSLFSHGPIKRHIKFNSPSSHRDSLRITESEHGSDPLHCHVTFWAWFTHPWTRFPPEQIRESYCRVWAAPQLWCVRPTWVAGGQRDKRETKALNVHLSFSDIYRCGILWWGIL